MGVATSFDKDLSNRGELGRKQIKLVIAMGLAIPGDIAEFRGYVIKSSCGLGCLDTFRPFWQIL